MTPEEHRERSKPIVFAANGGAGNIIIARPIEAVALMEAA